MDTPAAVRPKKPSIPFTVDLQSRFLDLYKTCHSVEYAASQCGISRGNVYEKAKRDPNFGERFDLARQHVIGKFEQVADERALKGRCRPIYQGGKLVGEEWIPSDNLLLARLRKHDPDGYGTSRHQHDGQVDTTLQVNIMKFGTDKQGTDITWTEPVVIGSPPEALEPPKDDDDVEREPSVPDSRTQIKP
jgi:hypothetical protein